MQHVKQMNEHMAQIWTKPKSDRTEKLELFKQCRGNAKENEGHPHPPEQPAIGWERQEIVLEKFHFF